MSDLPFVIYRTRRFSYNVPFSLGFRFGGKRAPDMPDETFERMIINSLLPGQHPGEEERHSPPADR